MQFVVLDRQEALNALSPQMIEELMVALDAAANDPEITWYTDGTEHKYTHATARDEAWAARGRMSAYGRALLLLLLDA